MSLHVARTNSGVVWVHSEDKVGQDAGTLSGGAPIGLAATNDADALIALAPDCVSYTASGEARPKECIEDYCRMLAAGINQDQPGWVMQHSKKLASGPRDLPGTVNSSATHADTRGRGPY